jgi:NAD(P)H-flavin reductase
VVYGVRTEVEFAFSDEFTAWADAGLELHLTLSARHPGWKGEVGRVQQRMQAVPIEDAYVFLCGQAEMEREVSEMLVKRGVSEARIFVNH